MTGVAIAILEKIVCTIAFRAALCKQKISKLIGGGIDERHANQPSSVPVQYHSHLQFYFQSAIPCTARNCHCIFTVT